MTKLPQIKAQLVTALNEHPFDDYFIEPLFKMLRMQSEPTYNIAMIIESAQKIMPRSSFPPELDDVAVGLIHHFFSLRYFAYRRFNGTSANRFLTNASIEAGKDDELARIILTSQIVEGPKDEYGIQFDHVDFASKIRALVEGNDL